MKQIAFERGFIDVQNINLYSNGGPKDHRDSVLDESFSLKLHITAKVGLDIGLNMMVDRKPKCHPELAGEGIEHIWANSKIYMRGASISKRRKQTQFYDQIRLALSQQQGAMMTT
eukprot:9070095-Ditylum_brightwellii.AAC.1